MKKRLVSIILSVAIIMLSFSCITTVAAATTIVKNGTFESGTTYWNRSNTSVLTVDNSTKRNGNYSMKATSSFHATLSQAVTLAYNTKYEFSFWYKGTVPDNTSLWSISYNGITFDDASVLIKGGMVSSPDEWRQVTAVFETDNKKDFVIAFQTVTGANYNIDDVSIEISSSATSSFTALGNGSVLALPTSNPYNNYPYICNDNKNIFTYKGFENADTADAFFISGVADIVTDEHYNGSKALKFTSGSTEKATSVKLSVEPQTEYWITGYVKSPYYSATNICEASFGIANSDTGNFLHFDTTGSVETQRLFTDATQLVVTGDNEWHMFTAKFNTGDLSNVDFVIRGTNSIAYFDDIYIFKNSDAVSYETPIEALDDITVTDPAPTCLNIEDESDNLLENSDLSDGDNYWQDNKCYSYSRTLKVADTGNTAHGNALYYKNTMTNPHNIYYIKWIDIEVDTDYTFSTDVQIINPGKANIGIISGYKYENNSESENMVYPTKLWQYDFNNTNFNSDYSWNTVGVTFNSGEHNRIGIFVFDGGGETYVDNLKLFDASNGVEPEEPQPSKVITPLVSNWTVSNGVLSGVNVGNTIATLKLHLADGDNIFVTDENGNEITDENTVLTDGMYVKLRDGLTVADSCRILTVVDEKKQVDSWAFFSDEHSNMQKLGGKFEANTAKTIYINNSIYGDDTCKITNRSINNGIYTAQTGSTAYKSFNILSYKLTSPLVAGEQYTFSTGFYSNGKWAEQIQLRMATSNPVQDRWNNSAGDMTTQLSAYLLIESRNDGKGVYIPTATDNRISFTFTATAEMVSNQYIVFAFQVGKESGDIFCLKDAKLEQSVFSNAATYDFDLADDISAKKGNMTETYTYTGTKSGFSGQKAVKRYGTQAIIGFTKMNLTANTQYQLDIRTLISYSQSTNLYLYAFPSDAQFTATTQGKLIKSLGSVSTNNPVNSGVNPYYDLSFIFDTANSDIDFTQYPILTLVYQANDSSNHDILLYSADIKQRNTKYTSPAPQLGVSVVNKECGSIELTEIGGVEYGYSENGTDFVWQDSNVISGLTSTSDYYFAIRSKETFDFYASERTEAFTENAHVIVIDERVEPTCSETGLTEGSHCSGCGAVIVEQQVIPTTEHTQAIRFENIVAPSFNSDTKTYTNGSCDEIVYCSICNTEISRTANRELSIDDYAEAKDLESLLKVYTQTNKSTDSVRIITLLDKDISVYGQVGFKISIDGANAYDRAVNTVYTSLINNGETLYASDVNENALYFVILTMYFNPNSMPEVITVQPYLEFWADSDGKYESVTGETKDINIPALLNG